MANQNTLLYEPHELTIRLTEREARELRRATQKVRMALTGNPEVLDSAFARAQIMRGVREVNGAEA